MNQIAKILAPVALVLTLGLAACSSGDDDGGVASLDDGDSSSSESTNDPEANPEEAMANYQECMTEHGIDPDDLGMVFDGGPNDGGESNRNDDEEPMTDAEKQAFSEAEEECQKFLPTRELSPDQESQMREQAAAYAECMRDKGFDIPDPELTGGGIGMDLEGSGIDPQDPAFLEADQACMEEHMAEPPSPPEGEQP